MTNSWRLQFCTALFAYSAACAVDATAIDELDDSDDVELELGKTDGTAVSKQQGIDAVLALIAADYRGVTPSGRPCRIRTTYNDATPYLAVSVGETASVDPTELVIGGNTRDIQVADAPPYSRLYIRETGADDHVGAYRRYNNLSVRRSSSGAPVSVRVTRTTYTIRGRSFAGSTCQQLVVDR